MKFSKNLFVFIAIAFVIGKCSSSGFEEDPCDSDEDADVVEILDHASVLLSMSKAEAAIACCKVSL